MTRGCEMKQAEDGHTRVTIEGLDPPEAKLCDQLNMAEAERGGA
jgi:hypothetical protein